MREEGLREPARKDVAVGRVLKVKGFSTLPGSDDDFFFVGTDGGVEGGPIRGLGASKLVEAARDLLASASGCPVVELTVEVGDKEAVAAGLACGGQVELVLQAASAIPAQLWESLARREPVALLSWLQEPKSAIVAVGGQVAGQPLSTELLEAASRALQEGRSTRHVMELEDSRFLLEAWVPEPRLVVVGDGELLAAISAQAGLLGWETRGSPGLEEVQGLLDWAGASGALIVLSHDPHVDVPALAAGLAHGTKYVGALGSRHTQSRRTEQLSALGIGPGELARLHRPVGLDLGGRRAPEVALAIVAEILADHYGRTGLPLRELRGPIHA
jgi:xanthine dehydrogenase accessory factor